jgi:hypothetical protein
MTQHSTPPLSTVPITTRPAPTKQQPPCEANASTPTQVCFCRADAGCARDQTCSNIQC